MGKENLKEDDGYLAAAVERIKTVLRGVYGTDIHIVMQEERDHASKAIMRMAYEADNIKHTVSKTKVANADEVLKAMVKDLET